jgi:hypothetical protein
MARTAKPANNSTIPVQDVVGPLIDDYVSQTDVTNQAVASNLNFASGKRPLNDSQPLFVLPSYTVYGSAGTYYAMDGNGVVQESDADATVALQYALTAIHAAGGGTLFIRAGTYSITTTLFVGTNTEIRGEGGRGKISLNHATVLALANNVNADLLQSKDYGANTQNQGIVIRDIGLNGNDANNAATSNGIRIASKDFLLENVYIFNFNDYGIVAAGFAEDANWGHRWTIDTCFVEECRGGGIYIGNYCYDGTIINVQCGDSAGSQIFLAAGSGPTRVIGCHVWSGWGGAVGMTINCYEVRIIGCEFENCYTHGLVLQATSVTGVKRIQIIGSDFFDDSTGVDNTSSHIYIDGYDGTNKVEHVIISNNFFWNTGQIQKYDIEIADGNVDGVKILGNQFDGQGTAAVIIAANATNTLIDQNDFEGSTADVVDSGTGTMFGNNIDSAGNWDHDVEP